jgi:hypothetical protein
VATNGTMTDLGNLGSKYNNAYSLNKAIAWTGDNKKKPPMSAGRYTVFTLDEGLDCNNFMN